VLVVGTQVTAAVGSKHNEPDSDTEKLTAFGGINLGAQCRAVV